MNILRVGLVVAFAADSLLAADLVQEVKENGQTYLDLDNGLIALRIAPERGARIISFKPKFSGHNWVHPEPTFGMALDHFAGQGHPGELDKVVYNYRIETNGVELWATTAQGTRAVPAGIEVRKRITLAAESCAVTIRYALINASTNAFRVAFMPKFDVYVSGDRAENYYYRPSARGLDIAWPGGDGRPDHGEHFLKNPIAGWTAALNRRTRDGLAFALDYNYLQWLYNCLPYNTVEWLYDPVSLLPGASWQTEVKLLPFHGLTNITFASADLVADTEVAVKEGRLTVRHHLCAPEHELNDVKLQTRLRQIATLEEYALPELAVKRITADPITLTTEEAMPEDSGLTITVTVTGRRGEQPFTHEYDHYHRGVKGGGFDLLTSAERGYAKAPPRKLKRFADPTGVAYAPVQPPTIFEMRGLYGNLFRTREAAEQAGMKLDPLAYARCSWDGHSLDLFPFDFKELFQFSAVILNNVDGTALDSEMQFMLKHYVKAGGGLLLLGGYYAYGLGGWNELTELQEVFPVRIAGPFDLQPVRSDGRITAAAGRLYGPADFSRRAQVRWAHAVEAKAVAETVAYAGRLPFIVTGCHGNGRVAAVCASVLGTPAPGHQLFWQDDRWPANLATLLKWLTGETP